MKVEMEFPADYLTNEPGVIHIGRLYLGRFESSFVGRIFLWSDGSVRLAIDKTALEKGYIRLYDPPSEENILGFGTKQP